MELTPGSRLGPYENLSRLGVGGMGEVWKARDPRLDRSAAIKTSHAKFSERFGQKHALSRRLPALPSVGAILAVVLPTQVRCHPHGRQSPPSRDTSGDAR